jgi:putative GTP pyrophosphokinase
MSRDIKPLNSKRRIDRAGNNIRAYLLTSESPEQATDFVQFKISGFGLTEMPLLNKCAQDEDIGIIENWRASHNHILNSWQATLRNRISKSNYSVVFAQRLKRRNTIYDKLIREPTMSLSRMEDIAGCRLIFEKMEDLHDFRSNFHRSKILHKRRYSDKKPYPRDYISHPKSSGYRGIHDIYSTQARKGRSSDWNGLHVEIQYRTIYQHAWATAVETAGYLTGNHVKFDRGNEQHKRFFQLASEVLARVYENERSCLSEMSHMELIAELKSLESEIGLLRLLSNVHDVAKTDRKKSENIILMLDPENKKPTEVRSFKSTPKAIAAYEELEKENNNLDIVLVRAKDFSSIQKAYKNYFWDTTDFVGYMEEGMKKLSTS